MNHMMNTYTRHPINLVRGQGIWVYDEFGTPYLDCVSGVAANSLGHANASLNEVITNQIGRLTHVSNLYTTPEMNRLSKQLVLKSGMNSVFFSNSGTESVEAALKIARKFGSLTGNQKNKILYISGSFHGRTVGSLAVTSNENYRHPFLPLVTHTLSCPANDIHSLTDLMDHEVCAIIMEPIQGESGVHPLDRDFIKHARTLADNYDALLIFDEVQCGIGRTGCLFYYQTLDVAPDVLCLAKGLGAGFPIGATLVNKRADVLSPGDHGSTFGGNPLACAVAEHVLSTVSHVDFLKSVDEMSAVLKDGILGLDSPLIDSLTGAGLLIGIQLKVKASEVVREALKENLLLIGAGPTCVRILPPLNVTKEECQEIVKRLGKALDSIK
ncbi:MULTISPECIES: aspartate aminotransferase family protein [unclassified Fusibacter]|uniref:aspartate aminotransferase family protein n=1 Tax=unclassified Fusibacter TaxID=2624464 RepID=UPI001010579F|nr:MULTISPECIES: acetylornithine/succinylornithine family transaminase [unclassified Fusibacter]MCK8059503.1 acetylornithine/succinylornithine family transaminase [Fusibacter sp. A2]NPE21033.1 acetylornithine/succinylornithine family transaminase [Fusibacter sp. A1]RXV62307.1 aminotransferase class III-fold pyridoxal phosphate-dependent enzyme [Fusibacter sp. A1]